MYGAIIGDIIGSPYEFDRGDKSREFELFTEKCEFTDDTVMTVAVAEALLNARRDGVDHDERAVKKMLVESIKDWGHRYPNSGYGLKFENWLFSIHSEPYYSLGNGSGMRVSPVGWLYDKMDRTREVARWTAEITHDHPEGVKGAESTAAAVFLARQGKKQQEIREYLGDEFGYDLTRTLDEIRPNYRHVETCMETMPEAFTCFFESCDYESCVRNVMYIGGDTDTLAAIAGGIAEAAFGVPKEIVERARNYLTEDIQAVVDRFYEEKEKKKC